MPLDFPNSPSNGATYASGGITWQYDGEKWNILAGGGPTYETSLPSSPSDGREIYYAASATDSVIWHLRYRAAARSGSGAWEFIGGPPLVDGPKGSSSIANTTSWTAISDGPSITAPRPGSYDVFWSLRIQTTAGGSADAMAGISLGGSQPSASESLSTVGTMMDVFDSATHAKIRRIETTTSQALTVQARNITASRTILYSGVVLSVQPVHIW